MEPTPTADLDRSNDKVYDCTTSVVKAVMSLSQGEFCLLLSDVAVELTWLLQSALLAC
jgi:hypothetical protein